MTNKTTKSALLTSSISLLLCFAMLLGTTFAWFTDSVTSSLNVIKSGTLKIDLIHNTKSGDISIKGNANHKIFNYDKWEPGYTQVETLTVVNEGTLALKYEMTANVENAILGENNENLADVIDVYMCFGKSTATSATDLADTNKWWKIGTLSQWMSAERLTSGKLLPEGATYNGTLLGEDGVMIGSQTVSIALHMQESAGNEYQGLSVGDIGLVLNATQFINEEDSFGKDYDEDAKYPPIAWDGSVDTSWFDAGKTEFTISNGAQLAGMAELGNKLGGKTITLDSNVDLGGKNWTPIKIFDPENSFTFDGGNNTIYNLNVTSGSDRGLFDNSVGTIKNLKLSNAQMNSGGRSAILAGRHYGNILNCHIKDSTVEDSYWAAGGIVGLLNSGDIKNCSITNVNVKSNGGVGGIVGVLNETSGTRSVENCSVIGGTIENTGIYGSAYSGGGIVGMINIGNSTVNIKGCSSTATLKGNHIYEICPPADDDITLNIN